MFGIKIPSLSKFTSRQQLPWTIGGLVAGGALYFILTGQNTGIGPADSVLREVGDLTKLEGVFANQTPTGLKHAPGHTTTVHNTPSLGVGLGPFPNAYEAPYTGLHPAGYKEQDLTLQFSGVGEFGQDDGRLTIA